MLQNLIDLLQFQIKTIMSWSFDWLSISEVLVIVIMVLAFYKKFIKNTQSEKLVKGILFLVIAWVLSEILLVLDLKILGMFIRGLVSLVSLSLIVIFQPELRRFLGYLGQPGFISKTFWKTSSVHDDEEMVDVIKEIIESVKYLSKTRTGALIVFQKEMSPAISDVGTRINADVSTELILTIFHPNTPLHDGAMVVKDNKIFSAGVLLPLTEDPKLSWKYGTRHRAAIGMSEVSDAACLVVSEETGDVSVTLDGTIKKYEDLATLKKDLENVLGYKKETDDNKKKIFNFNNFMAKKQEETNKVKKEL